MLIHVIVRALVSRTPVLTYRTDQTVQIGQLVQVPLRGRSIPGIVVKINVAADTTAPIQSVTTVGSTVLPESYITSLQQIADYYGVLPAAVWIQIGAAITRPYLATTLTPRTDQQDCVVTPAHTTPLAHALRTTTSSVPDHTHERRTQWLKAAAGHSVRVMGGVAAITLPYRSLRSIVLDAPFASPYRSNRSPGFNTAVISCLVAQSTGAKLTIRTPLPPSIVKALLPLPTKTAFVHPKLHHITAAPLGTRGYVNQELIDTIKEQVSAQKRVLIYVNSLPKHNGLNWGITQIASELAQKIGQPVTITHKGSDPADSAIIVATAHALYDHDLTWDFSVILSVEGLISANQPHSPMAAAETIASLASRTPVYAQYRLLEHPLVQAVTQQLTPDSLSQLPLFTKRLLTARFPAQSTPQTIAFRTTLESQWPAPLTNTEKTVLTFMIDRELLPHHRAILMTRPKGVRLFTDDDILPSDILVKAS